MKSSKIEYKDTGKFSDLVIDYLSRKEGLKPFYNRFPDMESFQNQIQEKKEQAINRSLLVDVLDKQNANTNLSEASRNNIESLKQNNAFTVTTGHQLCLFTGPLYFIYKIISTINLAEELQKE